MRRLVVPAVVLWLGLACCFASVAADDAAVAIQRAIVADSAMMHEDFEKLAIITERTPRPSHVEDKSLTLMLLALNVRDDDKAREEFRFLTTDRYPRPSALGEELYRLRQAGRRRILLEPVTFIHLDRITDFTCKVDGDRATGTVSFKAPGLYQGKVQYAAERHDGKWFITEFTMPAYGIRIVRADDGLWKQKL